MLGIMAGMNQTDIFALFVDPCRGAEVISHGPDCCRTQEIHQFADTVADFPVVRVVQILRKTFIHAPTVAAR